MTNLFENIHPKNIEKLKRILGAHNTVYQKNVNVLSNVNQDEFIAIIEKGSAILEYNDYDGNKILLEDLREGDVFTTLTLKLKSEEITCTTKEETQITYIDYSRITSDEIVRTDFYILFIKNLIKLLSRQISSKNDRIEILTKKTTRDKLLEYFKQASQSKGSKEFSLPMTFSELSNYISVDRSAMSREIGYLKEDGLIKTEGKRITLLY